MVKRTLGRVCRNAIASFERPRCLPHVEPINIQIWIAPDPLVELLDILKRRIVLFWKETTHPASSIAGWGHLIEGFKLIHRLLIQLMADFFAGHQSQNHVCFVVFQA